jgi:UDP-N-acetyl-D-glucosamine dehydrogenase
MCEAIWSGHIVRKVCVQGLGYVGAAMAAAVAEARDQSGEPFFGVVGVDLPNSSGSARIDAINNGRFPFETGDSALSNAVARGRETGNLRASADAGEYEDCDVVVVDVPLDVHFDAVPPAARFDEYLAAIRTLANRIPAGTLVLVETTVPPGTTEKLTLPELTKGFTARGLDPERVLVAHSYERVMPGRDYLASITNYWRVYAGATEESAQACEEFLKCIIDTKKYPLTRLMRLMESEVAKLMENSFRALNIAFIDEWARFAECTGMDITAVVRAIRMRPTHQNIMRPGFGVGGYCLTKDPLLGGIGARDFFGLLDLSFPFCEAAVRTNHLMPRATIAMLRTAMSELANKHVLLLGATYREDVADTRFSPSKDFVLWAEAEGASIDVHDPLVSELEGIGRPVMRDLPPPSGYDAAVFAVAHDSYRKLQPQEWLGNARPLILDANSVLSPEQIALFQNAGCRVKAIGRGDL